MAKRKQVSTREQLEEIIEEGTVDSNGLDEQHSGMVSVVQDNVDCPFHARVAGEEVMVNSLDFPKSGYGLVAVCERGGKKHKVDINGLQFIDPLPDGYEYIEAFKMWQGDADDEVEDEDDDNDDDGYDDEEED